MKKLLLALLLAYRMSSAQTSPTLSVGLESLTMNKGTIDVKVLTEIIMEKQKELKQEALKRFMLKMFPEANYTTKFYVQNCLNILLNEKNPQVIEKEILELTTNYALALGTAYALVKTKGPAIKKINEIYLDYKPSSIYYQEKIIRDYESVFKKKTRLLCLEMKKIAHEKKMIALKSELPSLSNFKDIKAEQNKIDHYRKIISRVKLRHNIKKSDTIYQLSIAVLAQIGDERQKLGGQEQSNEEKKSKSFLSKAQKYVRNADMEKLRELLEKEPTETQKFTSIAEKLTQITQTNPLSSPEQIIDTELRLLSQHFTTANSSFNAVQSIEKINARLSQIQQQDTIGQKYADEFLRNLDDMKTCIGANGTCGANINATKSIFKKLMAAKAIQLPFVHILDVVSLSLSEIEELQKKGFFKNKIDYRSDTFYKNLGESDQGTAYRKGLDEFQFEVTKQIRPYIKHYYVIKEFLKKGDKSVKDIIGMLLAENIDKTIAYLSEKNKGSDRSAWIDEIVAFEKPSVQIEIKQIWKDIHERNKQIQKAQKAIEDLDGLNSTLSYKEQNTEGQTTFDAQKNKANSSVGQALRGAISIKSFGAYYLPVERLIHADTSATPENVADINNLIQKYNTTKAISDYKTLRAKVEQIKDDTIPKNANQIRKKLIEITDAVYKDKSRIKNELVKLVREKDSLNKADYKTIPEKCENFYTQYLKDHLKEVLARYTKTDAASQVFITEELDSTTISKASRILSEIYSRTKNIAESSDVELKDVLFFEDYVNGVMVELQVRDSKNDDVYRKVMSDIQILIPLLKTKILSEITGFEDYNEKLMTLFEFISNLNNLDRAQTYQSIVDMLRDGSKKVENNLSEGEFKDSYVLFINAMKKYTIINPNPKKEYVEVDVVSFLNDLQQYYGRKNTSRFGLYLTLGLNQNFFFQNFGFPDSPTTERINNISFASEKIGVKYRIHTVRQFKGYETAVKDDVYLNKNAPFVNQVYAIAYGSGLLYSLANTSTNENFDFPHAGLGLGIRFYNALDVNLTLGFPFVKHSNFGDHAFWGFGLDIPLGEYLEKIGNKK